MIGYKMDKPLITFPDYEAYKSFVANFISSDIEYSSKDGTNTLMKLNLLTFDGYRYQLLTKEDLGFNI